VIFRTATTGDSTYATVDFCIVAKPDPSGRVVIDFKPCLHPAMRLHPVRNLPLPPRQNWLALAVRAGERKPTAHPLNRCFTFRAVLQQTRVHTQRG